VSGARQLSVVVVSRPLLVFRDRPYVRLYMALGLPGRPGGVDAMRRVVMITSREEQ
jgi:hypothetical protein